MTASDATSLVAIVAATRGELEPLRVRLEQPTVLHLDGPDVVLRGGLVGRQVALAASGVGTIAAATTITALAAALRPAAVLMTGIAGAYVGAFVPVGVAVAAASEFDLDAGVVGSEGHASLASASLDRGRGPDGPLYERVATDPAWRDALAAATRTVALPFATSDAVSGDLDVAARRAERSGASIESMEGVGAALACARLGLPFGEVRGVSNVAGVRDKAAWEIGRAVDAATSALLVALRAGPVDRPAGPGA